MLCGLQHPERNGHKNLMCNARESTTKPTRVVRGVRDYGCSTVVLIGITCPAITVATDILRALVRVRERALGCFARSPKSPPARRCVVSPTCHRVP